MANDRAQSIRRDAALMARLSAGEPDAAREIVHSYMAPIARFAAHLLKDSTEAEDVANEAIMRLWRTAGEWRPDGVISGWLRRSVYTQCIDRIRKAGRMLDDASGEAALNVEAREPSPEAAAYGAEIGVAISGALDNLPERQKAAVTLATIDGLSGQEIADVLEVSVEAVESLLARGRRALRDALKSIYRDTNAPAGKSQREEPRRIAT
jgi:RNA polymerase sigma-70 factor (ECF subfamily)